MARKSKDPTKPSKTYLAAHPSEARPSVPASSKPASTQPQPKGKGKGKAIGGSSSADALRQAIRDLGGDEEDYELVKGIESEDEVVGPKTKVVVEEVSGGRKR